MLFIHGLESSRGGSKHRWMCSTYGAENVQFVDMEMSLYRISKSNCIIRKMLWNVFTTWPSRVMAKSIGESLVGCLELQKPVFDRAPAGTVVVASSWGGAVAVLALATGAWSGPTVLIAPAYGAALSHGAYNPDHEPAAVYAAIKRNLTDEQRRSIIIVHGTEDDTVDVKYSRALAVASGIELIEIDGAGHRVNEHILNRRGDQEPLLEKWVRCCRM